MGMDLLRTLAFTGHRVYPNQDWVGENLAMLIDICQEKRGITDWIIGGAMGFDLLAGEMIVELKADLHIYLPFIDHTAKWPEDQIARYYAIAEHAVEIKHISNSKTFTGPELYYDRNRAMVDNASHLIACYAEGHRRSGTKQTLNYANQRTESPRHIFVMNPRDCSILVHGQLANVR